MTDDTALLIRVPATEVDDLIDAGLVQRSHSDERGLPLAEVLDAAVMVQDVAGAVVLVSAGVKGVRDLLRRLRKRDDGKSVTIVVQTDGERFEWTGDATKVDDDVIDEVCSRLRPRPPAD